MDDDYVINYKTFCLKSSLSCVGFVVCSFLAFKIILEIKRILSITGMSEVVLWLINGFFFIINKCRNKTSKSECGL